MTPTLPDDLLALLRRVDTPTVCNAIEVAQGRRGFSAFTRGTIAHSRPGDPPVVGYAATAKIAGLEPPTEAPDVIRTRRMAYFRAMASGPRPGVAVVEDTDGADAIAGWWGEVHVAVHKGLGLAGAVTNGVMRDLDVLDAGFPVLAGSVGVSHGFVHVVEIGTGAEVFGLRIQEGDLVHADRHGALVIPESVLPDLKTAVEKVIAAEAIVLEPARRAGFDIKVLEEVWSAFEKART
ncbi:MAG: RraA family protein [Pseudomonadota bacterium]